MFTSHAKVPAVLAFVFLVLSSQLGFADSSRLPTPPTPSVPQEPPMESELPEEPEAPLPDPDSDLSDEDPSDPNPSDSNQLVVPPDQGMPNEFDEPSPEMDLNAYQTVKFKNEIQEEIRVRCVRRQCELIAFESEDKGWSVEFGIGRGNQNSNTGSNGIVIVGNDRGSSGNENYVGFSVKYRSTKCRESIQVSQSVFTVITASNYQFFNEDGSLRKNLTPLDQAVMRLYASIIHLRKGNSCTQGGS